MAKGEDGILVLFESQGEGENQQFFNTLANGGKPSVEIVDPTLLMSIHRGVSYWAILKALELKHYIGSSCKGFKDGFLALLTEIKARNNSASSSSKKKKKREIMNSRSSLGLQMMMVGRRALTGAVQRGGGKSAILRSLK